MPRALLNSICATTPCAARATMPDALSKLSSIREELNHLFLERADLIDGALCALALCQPYSHDRSARHRQVDARR